MSAKQFLHQMFNLISNEIEYKTKWENGTGYLDFAIDDDSITFDSNGYAKAVSPKGRKIVFVKTQLGNCVLFDRYTDPDSSVVVSNVPWRIEQLFCIRGSLDEEKIADIVGTPWSKNHIGNRINSFLCKNEE